MRSSLSMLFVVIAVMLAANVAFAEGRIVSLGPGGGDGTQPSTAVLDQQTEREKALQKQLDAALNENARLKQQLADAEQRSKNGGPDALAAANRYLDLSKQIQRTSDRITGLQGQLTAVKQDIAEIKDTLAKMASTVTEARDEAKSANAKAGEAITAANKANETAGEAATAARNAETRAGEAKDEAHKAKIKGDQLDTKLNWLLGLVIGGIVLFLAFVLVCILAWRNWVQPVLYDYRRRHDCSF